MPVDMVLQPASDLLPPTLNYPALDSDHAEFAAILHHLDQASGPRFVELWKELVTHTEKHFERENQLMGETKFPGRADHEDEHRRVVGQLRQFSTRVERGQLTFARAFAKETLPGWLQLHVPTMDALLVAHLAASGVAMPEPLEAVPAIDPGEVVVEAE
jgi:hemerythrin